MPHGTHGPFVEALVSFAGLLKEHDFAVSPPNVIDALEGVRLVGVEDLDAFKEVLRAAFMTRVEETPAFEHLFREFWLGQDVDDEECSDVNGKTEADTGHGVRFSEDWQSVVEIGAPESPEMEGPIPSPYVIYSPEEALRRKDFKEYCEEEDYPAARIIREITTPLIRRASVRRRASPSGSSVDFRKLLRKSAAHGGEILDLPGLKPKLRIRKIVFLCDVSGSMNPYLKFILRFIKELHALPTRVESFVFATRLSRITPLLVGLPFNQALNGIADTAMDWSGGTRIGSCLREFVGNHGGAMLRPSTVVLIHSDGWDRGDTDLLSTTMATIQRRSYRVIWINPLLGGPSYEPICRGMKAALPFVDSFIPGHNIAGLERIAGTLKALF